MLPGRRWRPSSRGLGNSLVSESDDYRRRHTSKGEDISGRREADTVDPSASRAGVFSADSVEGKFFTPDVGSRSRLDGLVLAKE